MDIPDNESFCVYPWFHQNIDSRGEVTLCCRSNQNMGHAKDLDKIWNGDEMREVRRKMLAGEKTSHCKTCYMHEAIGKRSNRQFANEEWYPESMWGPNLAESLDNSLKVTASPSRIDLKFGNLCNLTCRMCSGAYSSQINKDIEALQKLDPEGAKEFGQQPSTGSFNWYEEPRFWDIIDHYIPHLLQLDITGGEPTLVDQNMVILNRCIELGYAQQIKLSLNTNLTNVKPDFIAAIRQFGKVTINASIDGVDAVQEYIRYPSKWRIVERNLIKFFEMSKEQDLKVNVSSVCQIYNIFQMPEFVRRIRALFEEHGSDEPGKLMKHQLSHVMWPTYLSLENAPEPIRQDIIAMAEEWMDENEFDPIFGEPAYMNGFQTFINQCKKEPTKPITAEWLLGMTAFQDQNKKVTLAESVPELYSRLEAIA